MGQVFAFAGVRWWNIVQLRCYTAVTVELDCRLSQGYFYIPILNFAVLMNLRIPFEQAERHDFKHLLSTDHAIRNLIARFYWSETVDFKV